MYDASREGASLHNCNLAGVEYEYMMVWKRRNHVLNVADAAPSKRRAGAYSTRARRAMRDAAHVRERAFLLCIHIQKYGIYTYQTSSNNTNAEGCDFATCVRGSRRRLEDAPSADTLHRADEDDRLARRMPSSCLLLRPPARLPTSKSAGINRTVFCLFRSAV